METRIIGTKLVINFNLKTNQKINLGKLTELCKDLNAKYDPEFGWRSVNITKKPYYLYIFRTGKMNLVVSSEFNEEELNLFLESFFKERIKPCITKQ